MPTAMKSPATPAADRGAPVPVNPRIQFSPEMLPGLWEGIQQILGALRKGGVSAKTLELSHQRASQINGCSACLESGFRHGLKIGESELRMVTVAAWRDSPHFTAAERAALELTEAVTRMADREDPVPDEVWNLAAEYYDERQLATLVVSIALTNLFNRLNHSTRQLAQDW